MKLTKYEHSCVVLEQEGNKLVIDPGIYSTSFTDFSNIVGVVVTHKHSDHFDMAKLRAIKSLNNNVEILSTMDVAHDSLELSTRPVQAGYTTTIGPFTLEFFGGDHELYKGIQNIAVLVNGNYFHPGDSYTLPQKQIKVLGAPASAPWLRVAEASDFITNAKARVVIPIHNALLSEIGESIHYRILGEAAQKVGSEYKILKPGESIEI